MALKKEMDGPFTPLDFGNKAQSQVKNLRKEVINLQQPFQILTDKTKTLALGTAESVIGFNQFQKSAQLTSDLFTEISNVGNIGFKSITSNLALSDSSAASLIDSIEGLVDSLAESIPLTSDVSKMQGSVRETLASNESLQKAITDAGQREFNLQQEKLKSLKEEYYKHVESYKLTEKSLKETVIERDKEKEDLKRYEEELEILKKSNDLGSQATKIAEIQRLIEDKKIKVQDSTQKAKSLEIKQSELLSQRQETLTELTRASGAAYKTPEEATSNIIKHINRATDESVALTLRYKQFGDAAKTINDSMLAGGDVLSRFNKMQYEENYNAFKKEYQQRIQGTKDISKISETEYNLAFQRASLGKNIATAELEKSKIQEQIAKNNGVATEMQQKELILLDNIISQSKSQVENLNDTVERLGVVQEYEHRIAEEKERQAVIDKVKLDLGNKFTSILGDQGDELLEIGKAFKESMVSPLALVGALLGSALEEFSKIGVESRKFLDTTNLTVKQTEHVRHLAHDISLEYRAQGVEMEDVLNSTGALVNKYGSLNRVSDEAIEKVTLLGKAFGISSDNAAGVMYQLQASTGASAETAGNIAALGAQFAEAAGVAPDAVMADIAKSSEQIATYFKGTPQDLLRTAVEARRLGLDIGKVADISKNLLNFESSIEDQMTASVLLGREINLDKARQLAMEGKIEEAAKETLSQVGDLASFNKMNAVQKEAIAKAAGLTVAELQQSLEKQDAINNMTAAQRAEYEKNLGLLNEGNESAADRLLKEQRNQLTQEKIADAVAKIADIFANVLLPVLEPIFDLISGIFSFIEPALPFLKTGLQLFLGYKLAAFLLNTEFFKTRGLLGTLAAPFQMIGKGLTSAREGVVNLYKSTKDWLTKAKEGDGIWKSLKDKLSGLGPTLKSFFLGKGPKEWGKEATESFDKASKAGGSFFDKMKGWMEKFSFGPIDEEADDLESTLQDIAKSDLEKMGAEPIESAASTLQEKAQEKISEVVSPESTVESASTTLQDKAQEKGEELVGSVKESFMPDKVAESAEQAQEVEGKMATSSGEGTKSFLTNLSEGLTSMGTGKVLAGALNLIPASIGLIAMIPGLGGAKLLEKLNGAKFQENMYGLAYGLEAFGSGKVTTGSFNLITASVGLIAMIPGALGIGAINKVNGVLFSTNMTAIAAGLMAMSGTFMGSLALGAFAVAATLAIPSLIFLGGIALLGEVAAIGLAALGIGLTALGTAAATGLPFLAIGLIASLGATMIIFAIALEKAAPAIDTLSGSISNLLTTIGKEGISAVGGFYLLSQAMGVFALASMGILMTLPALGLLTAVISVLGPALTVVGTAIDSASDALIKLINNVEIDQLLAIAGGLTAIGLALSSISMFGMLALPALGAIAAISLGAGALFGGGEETTTAPAAAEEETGGTDNSALIAKMDELIAVITNSTTPIQLVVDGKVMAEAVGRKTERNYQANPRK